MSGISLTRRTGTPCYALIRWATRRSRERPSEYGVNVAFERLTCVSIGSGALASPTYIPSEVGESRTCLNRLGFRIRKTLTREPNDAVEK
jgi:hypothetical protein